MLNFPLRWLALIWVAVLAACASGTDGTATGNTELNLDIVNPGGTSGELGFSIDRVDYRITCEGSAPYPIPPTLDSVQNGSRCSTADLDTNGIPDVCPPGSNYIAGTAGSDNLTGGSGVNCIFGFGGNDTISGGNRADYICGGAGNDIIDGGNANDLIFGEGGNDTITGGNGNDLIEGGDGDDNVNGGSGNDNVDGGAGADQVIGGNGDDALSGGLGIDTLDGNNGSDLCVEEVPGTSTRLTNCESSYSDAVDISGAFEVVDTRVPPVWQAVMDLPPGNCTVTLSVYEDDEIVCVGSQTLAIAEDATTKYDIVLVCSLSIDTPDGMADIDGSFEFITGNLCPKLYVLNAIPSSATANGNNPYPETEIQYRAKDPDNSCGDNCDPQTCDFSNPPVCTPSPYNPNDPLCNPLAGGDPNSAACQADGAGLVCTVAAWPSATNPSGPGSGAPGGTFISPADGVTPVGPVLPVNLNTASGIPGVILPGLGGPAGTNAANSPAYPPLPNVSGSLPALVYQCDITKPGPTFITVSCSDGDADCDQSKLVVVSCGSGPESCISDPIDCSASSECLTDGVCDNFCDPSGSCDRCPGKDNPRAPGTLCSEGGGNVCDGAGNCVECLAAADCLSTFPPVDCQLPPTCTGGSCQAGGVAPAGTSCSNGICDGSGIGAGACQFDVCDPCDGDCGQVPASCNNVLALGCTNNVTADVSILPFTLNVNPDPILANTSTSAVFGGIAEFAEPFLDAAQGAVPGGVTTADLVSLTATVQIRSGGTMDAPVTLTNPPLPTTCLIGGTACDPINDGPSVPGSQPNTDCVPTGAFNPCQALVSVPTSTDCAVGGVCDALGKLSSQCAVNGFCAISGLPLPLEDVTGSFTPGASGTVNFGWADQGTGATVLPNGTYQLPAAVFTGPTQLNEIKVNASGLSVALVCTMAVDSGGPNGTTPPVPDQASPTPTSLLSTFNIQVP